MVNDRPNILVPIQLFGVAYPYTGFRGRYLIYRIGFVRGCITIGDFWKIQILLRPDSFFHFRALRLGCPPVSTFLLSILFPHSVRCAHSVAHSDGGEGIPFRPETVRNMISVGFGVSPAAYFPHLHFRNYPSTDDCQNK